MSNDLEELNVLRSELISSKNIIDELKNEVKMKVLLNNNFHKENEHLMIKLNNSLSEINSLKELMQSKEDVLEQHMKYKEDSLVSANIITELNKRINQNLKNNENGMSKFEDELREKDLELKSRDLELRELKGDLSTRGKE